MPDNEKYSSLDDVFNDDEFHLIESKGKQIVAKTADDRLIDSYKEIQDFVNDHGKEPAPNMANVTEYRLYSRLKGIREDPRKIEQLQEYDDKGLLPTVVEAESGEYVSSKKPKSLDEILNDEDLGLISGDDEQLFDFKHIPKEDHRASADFVARRKPCKDFEKYENLFVQVQKDLAAGKRKLVDFRLNNLQEGGYYVHNGLLFYLQKIIPTRKEHYKSDGTRVREDGRTRCIFENGTESNMLKRSVEKILYENGKVVTETAEDTNRKFEEKFSTISNNDEEAGYIYVLRSQSTDEQIASIPNLYKIGYSKSEVPDRIKNAEKEPTYLMAPVEYITGWRCYNLNPQKFEKLIHSFFGSSCLEVDVFDKKGRRHTPREWFIAPLHIIDQAIQLIIKGDVIYFRYDPISEEIVRR